MLKLKSLSTRIYAYNIFRANFGFEAVSYVSRGTTLRQLLAGLKFTVLGLDPTPDGAEDIRGNIENQPELVLCVEDETPYIDGSPQYFYIGVAPIDCKSLLKKVPKKFRRSPFKNGKRLSFWAMYKMRLGVFAHRSAK